VSELNSFGNPEFLKDLEFINNQLSTTGLSQHRGESQAISDVTELADALAAQGAGEESRLNQALEQACLATGASGAAIALVRGEKIVCHAATGTHAPDIGVCLDPRKGLSGSCIQTRQLQQCDDTERDPRVDPEACRHLGVRSIVVLPLMDGDELFGVFEILSPRPNAFGRRDLDSLQALTDGIVESRRQNWEATATVPRRESGPFLPKLEEVVPQHKSLSSAADPGFPRRERIFRRNDIRAAMLGVLVIASAVLLGTLLGWRLGWQKATLGFRASSPRSQAIAPSKNKRTGQTVIPGNEPQPSSAGTEECGPSAAADPPTQPPNGGLTIWQDGRVIFRLLPSAPSPIRDLQTSQRSPGLQADPTPR
jgi:putative methionine-R-sulfoxide reductase with GAF domain